ncbi:MAG: hypothetical protein ACXVEF_25650 [Polyangiales bacterium]
MRAAPLLLVLSVFGSTFAACSNKADHSGELTPVDSGFQLGESGPGFEIGVDETMEGGGCAHGSSEAKRVPVDIIFAIDQSESMDAEIAQVKKNINKLSDLLATTKLDYRVVMIARPGPDTFGVCIPPPLGADGCGDNLPRFKRSAQEVLSNDALALYLKTYDSTDPLLAWAAYVRHDSFKAFVPITDDNALQPPPAPYWQTFDQQILKRGMGAFGTAADRNYAFFPIIGAVSGKDVTDVRCSTGPGGVVNEGPEYQQLAKLTGGEHYAVCADDYGPIFTSMALAITTKVLCSLPVPTPPAGDTLDPNFVNVSETPPGGSSTDILQDNTKPCDAGANGWQYNSTKTKILLCGDACSKVVATPETVVSVVFGCKTKVR